MTVAPEPGGQRRSASPVGPTNVIIPSAATTDASRTGRASAWAGPHFGAPPAQVNTTLAFRMMVQAGMTEPD